MTVSKLIERLKQFDPDLLVCLGDWPGGWSNPSLTAAECIQVTNGLYYNGKSFTQREGTFLEIGYASAVFEEDNNG